MKKYSCILAVTMLLARLASAAVTLPAGFSVATVSQNLPSPTAMEFAPDGRLFVCLQTGELRVIKNSALLPTPFMTLGVDSYYERGLLGIAFDPNFATNQRLYLYYTSPTPVTHNRISRFTANGDVVVPGSEVVLLDLPALSAPNHNGGALHFGPDGKLYVGVGENGVPSNAQSFTTLLGKILRLNADGTIPTDNPFYGNAAVPAGNQSIWALGLRNPFTFAFQPGTGRLFLNDVGQDTWEEIDDGIAGANYGWPTCEGYCAPANPSLRDPIFRYQHGASASQGNCIAGGAFYNPSAAPFPAAYVGLYFFGDYVNGWLKTLNPAAGNAVADFATGLASPVDLRVGPDGLLYYLERGSGGVYKIQYSSGSQPVITTQPADVTVAVGAAASFTVAVSGTAPFTYQWQHNGAVLAGATAATYTLPTTSASDEGALFACVISNAGGSTTSRSATLHVSNNQPPVGTVTSPSVGATYAGGDTLSYGGTGTDPEDGTLPASAFSWTVELHHDSHIHPFLGPVNGVRTGTFVIPTTGETSASVWYRVLLTVTDSGGRTQTSFVDVLPRTATVTLTASVPGLSLTLDGQPQTAPAAFVGVTGIARTIGAATPQIFNGTNYEFTGWSDGGAATHGIVTPAVATIWTANYRPVLPLQQDAGADGLVVIEAEDYAATTALSGHAWQPAAAAGYSGAGALQALPNNGLNLDVGTPFLTASPRLDYPVQFLRTGTHYLWVRGLGATAQDSAVHVGLDGASSTTSDRVAGFFELGAGWQWTKWTLDRTVATVTVPTAGRHTLNVWMQQDGVILDKFILTSNPNYAPTGLGPVASPKSIVRGRHVFYNGSRFDGNDPAAGASDDAAIAPDKTALLPGGTATFINYTSYSRGLNGIMVDLAGLGGTPTASDFTFKIGNGNDPTTWSIAPAPQSVTVRAGAGDFGADRITLIWADNLIQKQWLQVVVKATPNTGLSAADVFYFGNAIGDSGDSASNALVNSTDIVGTRNNPQGFTNPALIDDAYDFNRDQLVNSTDLIIARNNQTSPFTALRLIAVPSGAASVGGFALLPTLRILAITPEAGGALRVRFVSQPGRMHRIQTASSPAAPDWADMTPQPLITESNGVFEFLDTAVAREPARFYRVVRP